MANSTIEWTIDSFDSFSGFEINSMVDQFDSGYGTESDFTALLLLLPIAHK